jgi:cytochrome c biogenesis protein CcmG, thiol:disulfide interchange protein DsbE
MPRLLAVLVLLACSAAVAACGDDTESAAPSERDTGRALSGAPGQLASLHRQANELLGGGADAFETRLRSLRGYPVVVNKWASWCGPCRAEFPFFQKVATDRGKEIAFVGVNSTDNDGAAKDFLERFPVPYPSYKDPDLQVAAVFNGTAAFPSTAFYDRDGKLRFVKQGGYANERLLLEDIERYAQG